MRHPVRTSMMLAVLAALGMVLLPQGGALAAGKAFCSHYADRAVAQHKRNLQLGCGFSGPRWHEYWQVHFGWCLGQKRRRARREIRVRRRMLQECAGPVTPQVRTFVAPRIGGVRLDWCLQRGRRCGQPAADAYCRLRGYSGAVDFERARRIGRWTDTRIIASGRLCSASYCDGFTYITCAR